MVYLVNKYYLFLHNKLSQNLQLKTIHICYLTVSVGQEPGCALDGCLSSGSLTRPPSPQGSTGKDPLPSSLMNVGRIQFLMGCYIILKASVPQFPATWASPQSMSQHGSLLHQIGQLCGNPPRVPKAGSNHEENNRETQTEGWHSTN